MTVVLVSLCFWAPEPLVSVNSSTTLTSTPRTVLSDLVLSRAAPVITGLERLSGSLYFQSRTLTPPMLSQFLIVDHRPMTVLPPVERRGRQNQSLPGPRRTYLPLYKILTWREQG